MRKFRANFQIYRQGGQLLRPDDVPVHTSVVKFELPLAGILGRFRVKSWWIVFLHPTAYFAINILSLSV